jgi:hypothetical protein
MRRKTKQCRQCGEKKAINQPTDEENGFGRQANTKDGYRHECRECVGLNISNGHKRSKRHKSVRSEVKVANQALQHANAKPEIDQISQTNQILEDLVTLLGRHFAASLTVVSVTIDVAARECVLTQRIRLEEVEP